MSRVNLDKLNQIKLKYGYASQQRVTDKPDIKTYMTNKREYNLEQQHFQNIVVSKVTQQPLNQPQYKSLAQNSYEKGEKIPSMTFKKNLLQVEKISESKVAPFLLEKTNKNVGEGKRSRPVINQIQTNKDVVESVNQISSIQKTYDLLKNYRMKIRTGFDTQKPTETQNKLILKEQKENEAKSVCISSASNQRESKHYYQSIKNDQNGQISKEKQIRTRCSPLATLDQNSVDVKRELSNIERLQDKIRSVLGVK